MGWSCRADASKVMDLWTAMCIATTGSSNVWKSGNDFYMDEHSGKEHDDGGITGTIMRFLPNMPDGSVDITKPGTCVKVSTYRINGDGTVKRGPAFLKALAKEAATLSREDVAKRRWAASDAWDAGVRT